VRDAVTKAVGEELKELEQEGTGLARHKPSELERDRSNEKGEEHEDDSMRGLDSSIRQELARRMMSGESLSTKVRMVKVAWCCNVCSLPQERAVMAGMNSVYDNWNWEFDEKTFTNSVICPRCGVVGSARGEALERARKEWRELFEVAGGDMNKMRAHMEEQEVLAARRMYNYVDPRNKKPETGDDK
jgi:hypothetical protein